MNWWNPKPLRPQADNSLFTLYEQPTVFKGVSPMQRQRQADGTPPTVSGLTALRPADPTLVVKSDLVKGSMVAKIEEKNPRYGVPKRDPVEPLGVIKSYMAYKSEDKKDDPDADSDEEMQEVTKASEHRDPEGGLTAAGRKHFNKKEGSDLKPGVKGKDADISDAEKKRKGSFLTRHYKGEHNAKKPLKDEKGEPTRHALQAQAWGEKTPKTPADRSKLVKDGERLLAKVEKSIAKAKRGWDTADSDEPVEKAALDKMFSSIDKLSKACGGAYMAKAEDDEDEDDIEKGDAYTKPSLRERIKNAVMAGSDGGKAGQWSARKAQLLAQKYKAAGGGYKGKRTDDQQSLSKWTKEDWTTSDGKKADRKGGTRRYLPKEAWEKLSSEEKEATNKKKVEGSKKGEQFVSNTGAAKKARDKAQDKDGDDKKVEKAALNKMFSSINNLTKACGGSYMVKSDDEDEQDEAEEAIESEESEEKALFGKTSAPKANAAGKKFGSAVVSAVAAPVKTVLGAARRR